MTTFDNLVIDLETMGGAPTGAIMQIGAVFMNYRERKLGPTFLRNVHLATAVRDGGTIDASTVIWWLGQSDEARKVRFNGVDIKEVLREFKLWVAGVCRLEDVRVWGNSNAFDLTILGGAYQRMGIEPPWYWTNERDFRTLRNMHPSVVYDTDEKGKEAHNALADAIFQAKHMFKIADSSKRPAATDEDISFD